MRLSVIFKLINNENTYEYIKLYKSAQLLNNKCTERENLSCYFKV